MDKQITVFSKKPIILYVFNYSPAMLIFLSTISAYVIAIIYESSYLAAFDLSPDLIELSPVTLFYSVLLVIFVYGVLEMYAQFNHYFTHKEVEAKTNKNTYRRFLYSLLENIAQSLYSILLIFVISGIFVSGSMTLSTFKFMVTISLVLLALPILIPISLGFKKLIAKKSLKACLESYFKKVDANNKRVSENKKKKLPVFNEKIGLYIFFFAITLCLPVIYATSAAHKEENYYVWSTNGDVKSLVVKHYGKNIIIKDYDTKKKRFLDGFTLASADREVSFKEKFRVDRWEK